MGGTPATGSAMTGAGAAIPGFIKGIGITSPTQFGVNMGAQALSQIAKSLPMAGGAGASKGPIMTNLPQINTMPNGTPNPQMAQGLMQPGQTQQKSVSPQFQGAASQASPMQSGQGAMSGKTPSLGGGAVAPVSQPTFSAPAQPVVNGFTQSQAIPGLPMPPMQQYGINSASGQMMQNLQYMQNPMYAQYMQQYRGQPS